MLKERPLVRAGDASFFLANLDALARVESAVNAGLNVVVTGRKGTGKTSLMAQVEARVGSNVHAVYALGANSAAMLIEAVAEDIAGPTTIRRDVYGSTLDKVLGKPVPQPSVRGRIVSSVDRLTGALEPLSFDPNELETDPLILIDTVSRSAVSELFGTYGDVLAKVPATWVVTVQPDLLGSQSNPAPNFLDEHVALGAPPMSIAIEVLASRTGWSQSDVADRLANYAGEQMDLRSLVSFGRDMTSGVPTGLPAFEGRRREAEKRLAGLGRPAAMLAAELRALGSVSPSDERLLNRMGWQRSRASDMLSKLHKQDLVTVADERGPSGGRPRRVYTLIPELRS